MDATTAKELMSQYSVGVLQAELKREQKIVYTDNGNRSESAQDFLRRIEPAAQRIGLTRVADISFLSTTAFPVFQSCRPDLFHDSSYGQNTGAQGKGSSSAQATISCIMESIEGYCCEPRVPQLMRGSFRFLSQQHPVYDPVRYVRRSKITPTADEPIMWTPAYSTRIDSLVWVPAEAVYFPFPASFYHTRPIFLSGSNGLASGASYLDATIHGLYEVIERYYIYCMEQGLLKVEAMFEHEVSDPALQNVFAPDSDCVIQLYCLSLPNICNLPMIRCCLITGDTFYSGWGCSSNVDISISRAISEAMQGRATHISGSREDMMPYALNQSEGSQEQAVQPEIEDDDNGFFGLSEPPEDRTVHLEQLRGRVHDMQFASLNQEYEFIRQWLAKLGYENIFIANLTRHGIDIPVVKVIIPEMQVPARSCKNPDGNAFEAASYARQFSIVSGTDGKGVRS